MSRVVEMGENAFDCFFPPAGIETAEVTGSNLLVTEGVISFA